jgi:hypothetical protein
MRGMTFSRRAALLQLASIPITLSLARTLRADNPVPPKRLVIVMQNNGTKRCNFWPAAPSPGASVYPITNTPILTSLFTNDGVTDNGLRAKTNLLRGLQVTNHVVTNGNEHDVGFARMFTGAQLMPTPDGAPWGGAKSVDQILADDWNVRSLTTAVYASEILARPKKGFDHRRSFSYVAPQTLNLPTVDPLTAYANTFPQTGGPSAAERLALRKSVLDSVAGDLQAISARLGPDDHRKLDFHLTAVRDAETKIAGLLGSQGGCAGALPPRDFKSIGPGFANNESNLETYVPAMLEAMVALVGAAIKCGLTRVASVQMGYGGGSWKFGWSGINTDHHGNVAHHDMADDEAGTAADPSDQIATTARVTTINQYYADLVRKLALDLDAAPDQGGTVLDNTLVVWANEFGRGDHQLTDIPAVLIGLVGNGIAKGGNVYDRAPDRGGPRPPSFVPHNVLGYHILNALGHATPGFGDIADMSPYAVPGF